MGQYWTRKNDQDDQDAEKTANPWAEKQVKGDRNLPDKEPTEYDLRACSPELLLI